MCVLGAGSSPNTFSQLTSSLTTQSGKRRGSLKKYKSLTGIESIEDAIFNEIKRLILDDGETKEGRWRRNFINKFSQYAKSDLLLETCREYLNQMKIRIINDKQEKFRKMYFKMNKIDTVLLYCMLCASNYYAPFLFLKTNFNEKNFFLKQNLHPIKDIVKIKN